MHVPELLGKRSLIKLGRKKNVLELKIRRADS
jgi:hypothetical protein